MSDPISVARRWVAEKDYDRALDAYRDATAVALLEMAELLRSLNRFDEAITQARALLDSKGPDFNAYALIGSIHELRDKKREANKVYHEGFQALGRIGQLQESADMALAMVKVFPDRPHGYTNLGGVLCKLRRFEQAEKVLRQALTLEPKLAAAFNNLGQALTGLGRPQEAIAAYYEADALAPDTDSIQVNVACNELMVGNFKRGWAAYERRISARS